MKTAVFQWLIRKHLLPHLPGFRAKGWLLFTEPPRRLLRGFAFEGSGFDQSAFNVWAFVKPLYVPSTHVTFTFGGRLGTLQGGQERWWRLSENNEHEVMSEVLAAIGDEGLPFLKQLESPADLAHKGGAVTHAPDNIRVMEAVAYSSILAGEYHDALETLDRLPKIVAQMDPKLSAWPREIAERAGRVRDALVHDPRGALALLDEWEAQTLRHLRLAEAGRRERGPEPHKRFAQPAASRR